jgi:hypothetical protein
VLAVATTLAAWAQSRLRQLPDQASLPPWFLSLGIACALLALAAAWLRYRHSAVLAIAIVVAIAAACAAIVGILVLTARSNAGREPFPAGWIEPRSTVPDGHPRAARFQQPAANDPAWFVVAEPEGDGFEGDTDVSVWRIDAPGASTPPEFEYRAERNRIYATNALASSVSSWPDKPMPAHASVPLDAWREEVMREAAGW